MDKYETVWRRFWASVIDSIIMGVGGWSLIFLFAAVTKNSTAAVSLLSTVGSVAYVILMHSYYGQTLGKMAARLKVLDISEKPINFGQAVLRSIHQLIPAMFAVSFSNADATNIFSLQMISGIIGGSTVIFYIADVIICLSAQKHRALHDFIAKTVVVRTDV